MNPVSIGTGRYSCPVCQLRFAVLAEKKQHVRLNHPKGVKS